MAQEFSQKKGIDCDETYALVTNFLVIRLLLAVAAIFKWHTRHIHIKCAYLYGELNEELYMKLPKPYQLKRRKAAKLKRLKQSRRSWNIEFVAFLLVKDASSITRVAKLITDRYEARDLSEISNILGVKIE